MFQLRITRVLFRRVFRRLFEVFGVVKDRTPRIREGQDVINGHLRRAIFVFRECFTVCALSDDAFGCHDRMAIYVYLTCAADGEAAFARHVACAVTCRTVIVFLSIRLTRYDARCDGTIAAMRVIDVSGNG